MAEQKNTEELEKELKTYKEIFDKLQPFIVLAINDYYVGDNTQAMKQKLESLGYNLQ